MRVPFPALAVIALAFLAAVPATAGARRPVVDLDAHPHRCVRLDRAVTYVGTPGDDQRCPAHVAGRPRARLLGGAKPVAPPASAARAAAIPRSAVDGTGLGFDACTAPSSATMATWLAASPYRTVGIYVGGRNRGCAQPNLTTDWVLEQASQGWSFIPTYVGLQAPGSSCCVAMEAGRAAAQGAVEADDAVAQAAALGFEAGTPIYFDLEGYRRSPDVSQTVLAFLSAWTQRLHARGYVSGVYSSAASGITELVEAGPFFFGSPDDVWIADWNGRATTDDSYVPSARWPGRRLHQYRGGHHETYGGVTIDVDNDFLGGDVAAPGAGPVAAPGPYDDVVKPPPPPCRVPKLVGKHLAKARSLLPRRHCRLGYVRGPRSGRIVRQQFQERSTRKPRARVGVKLR